MTPPPPQVAGSSLWRNRDFMLLWSGQTVSEVGSSVTQLAIPLAAVVLLDASTLQVGMLSAVAMLPWLLVSLPAGAIADRKPKHKLMMWCDLGRMLMVGSIPIATIPGLGLHLTYLHLVVVALLSGILTVFFDVSSQSYLPVLLTKDELVDGNAKIATTDSFAGFVAPSVGGLLIGVLGVARAIAVDAVSYAVSALSLFLIRKQEPTPEPRADGPKPKMRHEIAEGLRFVLKHPIIRRLIACTATGNLFASMFMAMSMIYLIRILHVKPGYIGLLWSAAAIGGMLGGLLVGRLTKRFGVARVIWMAPLVLGIPMFLQPLAQPGWGVLLYTAGYFSYSLYGVIYSVAQRSFLQASTPPELLGRMIASIRFIVFGTPPLGALIGGVLGSQLGVRETIWIGVAGVWLSGFLIFFSPLRKMREIDSQNVFSSEDAAEAEAVK